LKPLIAVLFVVAFSQSAAAQPKTHEEMWRLRVKNIVALRAKPPLDQAQRIEAEIDINLNVAGFALFAYAQGLTHELRLLEDARTDKQVGAPAGSAGSTGLVSKGAVPAILGFAVEHGALTQTADQTSVTLRGNGVGVLDLLKGQDLIEAYQDDSPFVRQLRRLSYSLTFDAAPGSTEASAERPEPAEIEAAAEETGRQLTSYSIRVTLLDQRDARRSDNRASASRLLEGAGVDLLKASMLFDPVVNSPDYRGWLAETRVALGALGEMTAADVERVLYARLEVLRQLMIARIPDFEVGIVRLVSALRTFEGARTAWFDRLQQRFVLAAEFVRNRQGDTPASWTGRVVGQGRPGQSAWDLAANFAVTRQDDGTALVPNEMSTGGWRDVQLAVQAERALGACSCLDRSSGIGRPVLSFEYLGRWLYERAVINFAGHDFAVGEGWIHAAQAKVTIPVKGSGAKIPLSVSVANRTELIREKTVRAHFGLTFDLDVLASAVRR